MKLRLLVLIMLLFGFFYSNVKAYGVENPGNPTVTVTVGEVETEVTVKSGMNCWTTRKAGYIGSLNGRYVVRFTANQKPIKMKYALCEGKVDISSEARAFWASKFYRFNYSWKIADAEFSILNPTPTFYEPDRNGNSYYDTYFSGGTYYVANGTFCYARAEPTLAVSYTPTITKTPTRTNTPSPTLTTSMTPTETLTPSVTETEDPDNPYTVTPTASITSTATRVRTSTLTITPTRSPTFTRVVKIGDTPISESLLIKITSNTNLYMAGTSCFDFYDRNYNLIGEFVTMNEVKNFVKRRYGTEPHDTKYIGRGGKFVTVTAKASVTRSPTIGSSINLPNNDSISMLKPRIGDICWGKEIAEYRNTIIEFTQNINYGIPIKNGGCITNGQYTSLQVQEYLRNLGFNYSVIDLPKIPTITRTPTLTVISELISDWRSGSASWFNPKKGVICWGEEIAGQRYSIVEFTKDMPSAVLIKHSLCTFNLRYTVGDIYNYLIRNGKRIDKVIKYP